MDVRSVADAGVSGLGYRLAPLTALRAVTPVRFSKSRLTLSGSVILFTRTVLRIPIPTYILYYSYSRQYEIIL